MSELAEKPRVRVPAYRVDDNASPPAKVEAFSFGDPVPVTDGYDFFYTGCWMLGTEWYEPPVDFPALSQTYRATAHHGSAIQVKRNILVRSFVPHRLLSRQAFSALATDYLVFGNCYLEQILGRLGKLLELRPARAKYVRRGADLERYFWVPNWAERTEFPQGSLIHLLEPDINQEVYGVPDYLGALQSIYLNENATLFRRKYYLNGSHAGFIMYVSDPAQNQEDIDAMRTALKESKGVGNFRNLFLYSPNGKKDGIQIIPISEVAAKDEFASIKNITRDDQLAGHRIPPQLMGIIPNNTGGFGDVEKAARVFVTNELEPVQAVFSEINDYLGEEVIRFRPYSLDAAKPSPIGTVT
ncbi:portal protein [Litchfieldella anticariensis FP35 = DSM 16096]|uniref:Portal protein n=1 Tax=Litchfieldella anticariensis (strain DSM 16096 / CECT 5854 / CIP 108499 / LMG 22089 / FP35) TaxID=1121939 RepID=S2KPL6_LITA3|nr:phage portal protein [Halomonas anticariensis]EPC02403.1 portal protein [Halomonas anticariensis FP35 = DSM 16096]